MRKRIISLVVILTLVLTLIPNVTFATSATDKFEVTINGQVTKYQTAVDAVNAVPNDGTPANIKLLDNYEGGGVQVKDGQNITFNLDKHTWKITNPLVGSTGTETNAFQLLKGATVTFKDGKITSSIAMIIFQNYCDLTVDSIDASLTTAREGNYVMSNNNGKTVIKNSTITASKTGLAMDSFTFGDYKGGDVVIGEGAIINGDMEVANGGKMNIAAGIVNGDIHVYNYKYDASSDKVPELKVTGGSIDGKVLAENKGQVVVDGSVVREIAVNKGEGHSANITVKSGAFEKGGEGIDIDNANVVVLEDKEGKIVNVVGKEYITSILKIAKEEDMLKSIRVLSAEEGMNFDVADGVTVENKSGNVINVNNKPLAVGDSITVEPPKAPVNPDEENTPVVPGDKEDLSSDNNHHKEDLNDASKNDKDKEKGPQTGDNTAVMLLAMLMVASGSLALILKKTTK